MAEPKTVEEDLARHEWRRRCQHWRRSLDMRPSSFANGIIDARVSTMPAVSAYPTAYIEACRGYVDHQISTFSALAVRIDAFANSVPSFVSLLHELETSFFNDLVIVLDAQFACRTRQLEGRDGNVLNEVRLLAASLMTNAGVLMHDESMTVDPSTSISGIGFDDAIALNRSTFPILAEAFFAQIAAMDQQADH